LATTALELGTVSPTSEVSATASGSIQIQKTPPRQIIFRLPFQDFERIIAIMPQNDHRCLATLWRVTVEAGLHPQGPDLRPAKPKTKSVNRLSGKVVS
jgi:hypothetical protein